MKTWIELKKRTGTIEGLYNYCILERMPDRNSCAGRLFIMCLIVELNASGGQATIDDGST